MEKLPTGLVAIVNLPGTGSILHRSWHLYTKYFGRFATFSALFGVGIIANTGLSALIAYSTKDGGGGAHALAQIGITAVGVVAALYVTFVFSGFIVFLNELRHGKLLAVRQSLEMGRKHVSSVFWVAVLLTFVLYGSLFTGILFIIFSFWYYFALYLAIIEGEKGVSALAKSRYLTHGLFWKIAGRYVAIVTLFFAAYFLAYLTLGIAAAGWIIFLLLLAVITFIGLPFFLLYDFIRFIDITAVQRTTDFETHRGERIAIFSWAIFGIVFFGSVWGLNLLSAEAQQRFIQSLAIGAAKIVLPAAQNVETNVEMIQELFGATPSTEPSTSEDAIDNLKNLLEDTGSEN